MNTSSAPFALEQTGITVFIPSTPVEEVQAGQKQDVVVSPDQLAAASAAEDHVSELEAPASRRIARSAAGHGVAIKGAVIAAERRRSTLTTVLIIAGVTVVLAVGGVVAYVVLA
jgi:hypothetical protein